jgi:transposase-like protein
MAYTKAFKLRAIKHAEMSISTVPIVAELKKIPKQTLYRWIKNYRMFGENSLENRNPGTKPMPQIDH